MKILQPLFILRAIVLLPILFAIGGCGDSDITAMVRKVTYPPDFKYVTGDELRSSMKQMAYQVQLLDNALAGIDTEQFSQLQQVLSALRNIEKIGSGLQAGDAGSSHPFLQDYMRDFVIDVGKARDAASLNPPNFYFAGRVSGGCVNCHKVNR